MRPLGDIIAEHARRRDKGNHLEQGITEGSLPIIAYIGHQHIHNPQRGNDDDTDVQLELGVLEQRSELHLENRHIE